MDKDRPWVTDEVDEIDYEPNKLAFPVLPFNPKKVDLGKVPVSAQEYLQQVITQRKMLPAVVTTTIPKLKGENLEPDYTSEEDDDDDDNNSYNNVPTLEWITQEINRFIELRKFVSNYVKTTKYQIYKELPQLNDMNGWYNFCFKKCNSDSRQNVEIVEQNTSPLLNIVLSMDDTMKERLIEYISEWLEGTGLPVYIAGAWLYAIFSTLPLPPTPHTIHNTRIIAKTCIKLRTRNRKPEIIAENARSSIIRLFQAGHWCESSLTNVPVDIDRIVKDKLIKKQLPVDIDRIVKDKLIKKQHTKDIS